ncbi:linear amide C-N hydrolase [Ohessyouella blattaphilus]|uniref:Linear amide C-N hydrolase n=1 Tax=Ohessyouella blattaphilus TaxID=2949333 RepID=A0ABT1EJR9_9FIRM|nr:linear amide C-N hydrolase [Ohessyouella blattaphilus]MCP1110951.1 linear amide C-N hydrolase [Ohessyouella blattaphilus]MCR8564345.1 linear amide C-N hydrolase [Ohessyouella blattaphilus]
MSKKWIRRLAAVVALALMMASLTGCKQSQNASATKAAKEEKSIEISPAEYNTLDSLEQVSDDFYFMDYQADYALDEMLALGATNTEELAYQVSEKVLHGLPFANTIPSLGCSAFTSVTPDGEYLQGRNLDIADAQNTLIRTQPKNGYASLATASGLALGYYDYMPEDKMGQLNLLAAPYYVVDGINEKGFSAAMLLLYAAPPVAQNTGKTAITTCMAIRLMLDKAADVEEAVALLEEYDMHSIANSNIHFQLADAQGNSVVIEYVNGEMRRLTPEEYGHVVTNYFLSKDVVEEYRDGEDRLQILQAALDEHEGVVTTEEAMAMLESVIANDDYDELSGINYNTSYSMVFNNSKKSVDICTGKNYDKVYSFDVVPQ